MIDNEQLQHPHPHHSIIDGSIESSAKRIERLTLSSTNSSSTSTSNNRIEPFRSQFSDGFAISIGKNHVMRVLIHSTNLSMKYGLM
jgi:hypothetical protein